MVRVFAASLMSLVLASAAWAQAPQPPPLSKLPEGPLQLVSGNRLGANFLDLERTRKIGDQYDLWILQVPPEPYALSPETPPEQRISMSVEHGKLDCANRVYALVSSEGFNAQEERVIWLPGAEAESIQPLTMFDFFAQVLCDGVQLPASNTVVGYEAAQGLTRRAGTAALLENGKTVKP